MSKNEPLPPPPDLSNQLSDSDEMQRVLEEHLLANNDGSASSVGDAAQPEQSGASKSESVIVQLVSAKDNGEIRVVVENLAKKFMSARQADTFNVPYSSEVRDFFVKAFDYLDQEQTIGFLDEFYKDFPNGGLLAEFCFNLRNISLLGSWTMSQLRDKMDKISQAIIAVKTEIVRAGGDGDLSSPKIIGNTGAIQGWAQKDDEISNFLDAFNSQQSGEVINTVRSASVLIAGRAAAIAIADLRIRDAFSGNSFLGRQDPISVARGLDMFSQEARRSFERILLNGSEEVDGSLGAIIKVAKEGGLYLGYFQESPNKPANAVVLCPNVL